LPHLPEEDIWVTFFPGSTRSCVLLMVRIENC
jgi:hypothetical protein